MCESSKPARTPQMITVHFCSSEISPLSSQFPFRSRLAAFCGAERKREREAFRKNIKWGFHHGPMKKKGTNSPSPSSQFSLHALGAVFCSSLFCGRLGRTHPAAVRPLFGRVCTVRISLVKRFIRLFNRMTVGPVSEVAEEQGKKLSCLLVFL